MLAYLIFSKVWGSEYRLRQESFFSWQVFRASEKALKSFIIV